MVLDFGSCPRRRWTCTRKSLPLNGTRDLVRGRGDGQLRRRGDAGQRRRHAFLFRQPDELTGDLMLDHGLTIVSAGAAFAGGGALVNAEESTLHFSAFRADLGVLVVNHGTLTLGGTGLGQIGGTVFEQTASGRWDLTVSGVGLAAFDRLTLTGTAVLDGTLDPQLMVGFVPSLGQGFNILSAAGGVTGEFAAINQPAGMPAGLNSTSFTVRRLCSFELLTRRPSPPTSTTTATSTATTSPSGKATSARTPRATPTVTATPTAPTSSPGSNSSAAGWRGALQAPCLSHRPCHCSRWRQ